MRSEAARQVCRGRSAPHHGPVFFARPKKTGEKKGRPACAVCFADCPVRIARRGSPAGTSVYRLARLRRPVAAPGVLRPHPCPFQSPPQVPGQGASRRQWPAPLASAGTQDWRLWRAPFGRAAGGPAAALRTLERELPFLRARALHLIRQRLAERARDEDAVHGGREPGGLLCSALRRGFPGRVGAALSG